MTINLQQFCNPDVPAIQKPFSYGKWTYATNGHIMVRVPRRDDIAENQVAPGETAENMFAEKQRNSWKPIADCQTENGIANGYGNVARYNPVYIEMIRSLPNPIINSTFPKSPLAFRFDGGEGLLMPIGEGPKKPYSLNEAEATDIYHALNGTALHLEAAVSADPKDEHAETKKAIAERMRALASRMIAPWPHED